MHNITNDTSAYPPNETRESEKKVTTIEEPKDTINNDTYTTEVTGALGKIMTLAAVKKTKTMVGLSIIVANGSANKKHATCVCGEED